MLFPEYSLLRSLGLGPGLDVNEHDDSVGPPTIEPLRLEPDDPSGFFTVIVNRAGSDGGTGDRTSAPIDETPSTPVAGDTLLTVAPIVAADELVVNVGVAAARKSVPETVTDSY